MFKNTFKYLIFLLFPVVMSAQDFSEFWEGHFSYLDIKDVSQGNNKMYAAAENAVFVYDFETNEIEKISTINGLSGEEISNIHYSENYGLLLIGYENGLIDIISDTNQDVLTVIDILDKPTIPPTNKRINHFNEYNDVVYISTDYGISVYNLNNLEFGDTYYIGDLGAQINVTQTTVFGDFIYFSSPTGIKKALVENPNLIDYQQWQSVNTSSWLGIESIGAKLYTISSDNRLYEIINDSFTQLQVYADLPTDIRSFDNKLIVTTLKAAYVYDSDFSILANATTSTEINTLFTSGLINANNELFIGTNGIVNSGKPGFGVLKTTFDDTSILEEIHPEGPLLNRVFSIKTPANEIWAVFGGYGETFGFGGGLPRTGISHFENDEWVNIKYDSIIAVTTNSRYISHIAVNPLDSDQVFISSYIDGLIEINDNEVTTLYNGENSTLTPYTTFRHYVLDSHYDKDNTLWVMNVRNIRPLNKYQNGQWTSFDFSELINPGNAEIGFSTIESDNQNNIYIASYRFGLIGFKENGGNPIIKNIIGEVDEGNLPSNFVTTLKMDNRNQLWIGTNKGIRVLYNPESIFTEEDPTVDEIIILDNGIANELLYQQSISDIEVDGSNNKWIGTFATGLYYFSQDGQETIFHFTKDNSPLPSNTITDVSIDDVNGKIYIATDKGLVSFSSDGSKPKDVLENAYVYPNPVRPAFNITDKKVKIKDISENVNIKITDIEGNLVAEAQSNTNLRYKNYNLEIDGGTAFWNGKNLANNTVSSGVYLVLLSDLDTLETKVLKLMVVR